MSSTQTGAVFNIAHDLVGKGGRRGGHGELKTHDQFLALVAGAQY